MEKIKQILSWILLVFGAILASNSNGSIKTIGIIFIATVVLKTTSVKNCFRKIIKH